MRNWSDGRIQSDRARGDGFELEEGRFRLDTTKTFFMTRVVKPWHRLPGETVNAPSLATLRPGWTGP